jgi:lysophospholipase L1-like esterase
VAQSRKGALYLLLAAALLGGYILNLEESRGQSKEEFPAIDWIKAQEQTDVGEIEQALLARDQEEAKAQQQETAMEEPEKKPMDKQSLRKRLGSAVIVGDSVVEGFLDYEFLESDCVIAEKGLRADTAAEEIRKALDLSPTQLFLSMGLNDLEYCRGDSERFIRYYRQRISEIRGDYPELPIYINGILPMLPEAVEKKAELGQADAFNEALRQMCEELEITFIDSGDLLEGKEDWYQKDAIHLKSQFYPLWLNRMEETAGL